MIQKLISHLHSVFNKRDSERVALLFCAHPAGFEWESDGRTFVARTEAGAALVNLRLLGLTVEQVVRALDAAGVRVDLLDPDYLQASATGLRGSGGGMVHLSRDVLHAIMDAYAMEIEAADQQILAALEQMSLGSAKGEFLEYWGGDIFGVAMSADETDQEYRARITAEILRPRLNPLALERILREVTGESIKIREPWRDMIVLGESALSKSSAFQDGRYFTYGVIQPVATKPLNWDKPIDLISRNRSAGIVVAEPFIQMPPLLAGAQIGSEVRSDGGIVSLRAASSAKAGEFTLDAMRLSVDGPVLNRRSSAFAFIVAITETGIRQPAQIERPRNIAKAGICLSDSDGLGAVNSIFGLGREVVSLSEEVLGEIRLDDGERFLFRDLVDEVIDRRNFFEIGPVSDFISADLARDILRASMTDRLGPYELGEISLSDAALSIATEILGRVDAMVFPAALAELAPVEDGGRVDVSAFIVPTSIPVALRDGRLDHFAAIARRLPPEAYWTGVWDGRTWVYPTARFHIVHESS